jgi:hypothetical protein
VFSRRAPHKRCKCASGPCSADAPSPADTPAASKPKPTTRKLGMCHHVPQVRRRQARPLGAVRGFRCRSRPQARPADGRDQATCSRRRGPKKDAKRVQRHCRDRNRSPDPRYGFATYGRRDLGFQASSTDKREAGLFTTDQVAVLASMRGCVIHKAGDYVSRSSFPASSVVRGNTSTSQLPTAGSGTRPRSSAPAAKQAASRITRSTSPGEDQTVTKNLEPARAPCPTPTRRC